MAFGTLNSILSTALSITFMQCCKIVLMFYNVECMVSSRPTELAYLQIASIGYSL